MLRETMKSTCYYLTPVIGFILQFSTHFSVLLKIFVFVTGISRKSLVISLSVPNGTSGLRKSSTNVVKTTLNGDKNKIKHQYLCEIS